MRTKKPSHSGTWVHICLVCACVSGCSGPNHDALCDKALVEAHNAYENKDYQQAADLLKVASTEAELSDASVHKHHVLREQIMVALAQNDPVAAERFARQLVEFEKAQQHVGNNASWRLQWADDMTRAEMLLGDSLRAQNRKREALAVYKAAIMHANQSVAPVTVSITVSERYVETLKELGLRKGELITDPGAAANAFEDYNDARTEMYGYRNSKEWKKLIVAADKTIAGAAECKHYSGGVAASVLAAVAEFIVGDTVKAREYAEQSLKIARDHPDDLTATQNSSGAWIVLAATDSEDSQAKKDMLTGYRIDWPQAETARASITQNLDQARWSQCFDRIVEIRLGALHCEHPPLRHECWNRWVADNLHHNRLPKGVAWLERMSARGEVDGQDLADCYEVILQNHKAIADINTKSWRRKILQIREGLRQKDPTDRFNLAHLADAYHFVGQDDKALKLAQAAQNGLAPSDPLNNYINRVIQHCGSNTKTPL
jgi:tetratricopeptide (TPR) repeat protein